MSSGYILSDNGVSSGSAGLKSGGGSDGTLLLQTTTSGGTATTAVTVDNAQNVGLGVTPSGNYQLQTQSNFTSGSKGFSLSSFAGGSSGNGVPFVGYNIVPTSTASSYKYNQTDVASAISFYDGVKFYVAPSGTAGNAISFTQAMTLDASGRLNVKLTSTPGAETISVAGSTSGGQDYCYWAQGATGGVTTYAMRMFSTTASAVVGSIQFNSSATAYNTSSDYRLKENIAPMTGALATVAQLKPCTYTWKVDGSDGQGFIAHELAEVVPDAVSGEKDAVNEDGSIKPQGIDTSFLVATLTAAIQEQMAIITAQQTALTTLTARIEALEGAKA